jgi:hypothetical protein
MDASLETVERDTALSREIEDLLGRADAALEETRAFYKAFRIDPRAPDRFFARPEWEGEGAEVRAMIAERHTVELGAEAKRLERRAGQGGGKGKRARISV